jgi:GT2 family glycosyltransferase
MSSDSATVPTEQVEPSHGASRPVISVVMPTFDRAEAIGLTLQYLQGQTLSPPDFEVLVVDDGSTDDTKHVVSSLQPSFSLRLLCQRNRGAAAARNLGAREALADLILFMDSDVVPGTSLLEQHVQSHTWPGKRLVVGRVKPWLNVSRPWYERVVDPDKAGLDYGEQERVVPFYMALGGNLSVTRFAFEQIGGYNETFPAAGCEETEFAYRASMLGYELLYQPRAKGYHNHPRSLEQRCRQQKAHMRSMALLTALHPELQTVIWGVDELMPVLAAPCSMRSVVRRVRAALYAFCPVRCALQQGLVLLNRLQILPRLSSILFWRVMIGCRHQGFRQGLGHYGHGKSRANGSL